MLLHAAELLGFEDFIPPFANTNGSDILKRRELCIRFSGDSQRDRVTFGIYVKLLLSLIIYIHLTYNLVLRYLPMWFCHDLCDVSFVSCIKSNHMFIYLIGSDFFKLNNSPAKTHLKGKVISIFYKKISYWY